MPFDASRPVVLARWQGEGSASQRRIDASRLVEWPRAVAGRGFELRGGGGSVAARRVARGDGGGWRIGATKSAGPGAVRPEAVTGYARDSSFLFIPPTHPICLWGWRPTPPGSRRLRPIGELRAPSPEGQHGSAHPQRNSGLAVAMHMEAARGVSVAILRGGGRGREGTAAGDGVVRGASGRGCASITDAMGARVCGAGGGERWAGRWRGCGLSI